jgi:Fur family ferric uptake transcriptional regulator
MARPALIAPTLLAAMKSEGAPHTWTLGEMCRQLKKQRVDCDPSTVFRAVRRLVERGLLVRLPNPGGRSLRYELAGTHHDHLLCRKCRRLVPIPCPLDPGVPERLESAAGLRVEGHELVLAGLCARCRRRHAPERPTAVSRREGRGHGDKLHEKTAFARPHDGGSSR